MRPTVAAPLSSVVLSIVGWLAVAGQARIVGTQQSTPGETPEARAVRFLVSEVPRWRREHPCYSCHNNGDAARALIAAARKGFEVDAAIGDTLSWLARPERWDDNAQGGGIDDKPLARVQFAAALTSAVDAGRALSESLRTAAEIVSRDQGNDGSWRLDSSQSVGSPATYGTALATWSARRTLVAAGHPQLASAIGRADAWLRAFDPKNMLDSAALVLALDRASDAEGRARRAHALDLLTKGQAPDGGWGLYATSASEPFDTAVAMLALSAVVDAGAISSETRNSLEAALARGRQFLVGKQLPDGSWPETTRPSGQESYAQRISTAGWATLALLASGT